MSQLFKLSLSVLYLFAPLTVSSALAGVALRFGMLTTLRRRLDAERVFRGRRGSVTTYAERCAWTDPPA